LSNKQAFSTLSPIMSAKRGFTRTLFFFASSINTALQAGDSGTFTNRQGLMMQRRWMMRNLLALLLTINLLICAGCSEQSKPDAASA
jgi:hypothetical protein